MPSCFTNALLCCTDNCPNIMGMSVYLSSLDIWMNLGSTALQARHQGA